MQVDGFNHIPPNKNLVDYSRSIFNDL